MPLDSILVPVDGSSPSLAALEHAVVLAEDGSASIDILHVDTADELGLATEAQDEIAEALDAAIDQAIARLGKRLSRRDVSGDPLRTIIETARDGRYDLIVIGTHGRIGRLHELLGSVAEGVVRNALCPVMTVREPGGGYQSFAERRHGRPSVSEPTPHHPR